MKINNPDIQFHTNMVQGKMDYEVESSVKMMDMLSNFLYKDKIRAVIRELSTNAWDSHIEAGKKDTPFLVQLPTRVAPTFRIRDYGTGMSPEKVEKMYRKYGRSDKGDSNDVQGCMGIGSKVGFCYTKTFTSVSYYNGMKHVWINAKDATGRPSLMRIESTPTDEPNGFEVYFDVKEKDCIEFTTTAKKVYRPFPVQPIVKGGMSDNFQVEPIKYVMKAKDGSWGLKNDSQNSSLAIMGFVEYPIEPKFFGDEELTHEQLEEKDNQWGRNSYWGYSGTQRNKYERLLSLGIDLHFEIGEVEMDMSREGLQYIGPTIDAIKAKLDEALEEIKEQLNKKFEGCDNLWDARVLYDRLSRGDLSGMTDLCGLAKLDYEGKDLTTNLKERDMPGTTLIKFEYSSYSRAATKVKRTDAVYGVNISSMASDSSEFYIDDMERGSYAACQRYIADQGNDTELIMLLKFDDDAAKKTFMELVGLKDKHLNKTSDIPAAPKQPKKKKNNERVFEFVISANAPTSTNSYGYRYRRATRQSNSSYWSASQVDMNAGGLYVEVNNWKVRKIENSAGVKGEYDCSRLAMLQNKATELGITVPTIHGVKTAIIGKFEKSSQWINAFTWFEKAIKAQLKKKKVMNYVEDIIQLDKFSNASKYRYIADVENPNKVKGSKLYKFIERSDKLVKVKEQYAAQVEAATQAAELLKFELDKASAEGYIGLDDEESEILKRYSMLSLIDEWDIRRGTNKQKVIDYINLVDKCCP
jgi:hypothetical protein